MSKVLLIEPDAVLARIYMQALQHVGHVVEHAYSAQDAINAADGLSPDVVVLELQLAVHNGIEFLHEFRSYSEWQGVPVVINTHLTPSAMASVQPILERDFGVTACLYKPRTSLQQLISIVKQQAVSV
jgi:DNA-binding response OmpR family regulator